MTARGRYRRREFLGAARSSTAVLLLVLALFSGAAYGDPGAIVPTPDPGAAPTPVATPDEPQVVLGAKPQAPEPSGPSTKLSDGATLSLSSGDVPQGGVLVIRRDFPERAVPSQVPVAHFDKIEVPFFEDGHAYIGLLGVPHEQKPGKAQVEVTVDGAKQTLSFNVHDGGFPHETLKVDAKLVNPPKKAMVRIKKEQAEIGEIYRRVTREKLWSGRWVKPIDSPMTSPYGTRRLYNGEERNYHGGLDLKAPIGTPIHAAASGTVVLAKDLYFTGNTVMIDHGYGLVSLYAHMSKIKVKNGQKVAQGDLLGLSGKTGRVNGPHLHWQVILHKTKVNPAELMKALGGPAP